MVWRPRGGEANRVEKRRLLPEMGAAALFLGIGSWPRRNETAASGVGGEAISRKGILSLPEILRKINVEGAFAPVRLPFGTFFG